MKYYPVYLDLKERECVVVGGGEVGARKALGLEGCGARVRVISCEFSEKFFPGEGSSLRLEKRPYEKKDLENAFLVFAATDNAGLNRQILEDARQMGILCCLADAPELGDFILPAVMARGDLVCAVSTSGTSPALAKKIKKDLAGMFGPEYAVFLVLMGNIRKRLLAEGHDPDQHKKIFRSLVEKDLPGLIAAKDREGINLILKDLLGREYDYQSLASQES
ncbi:precorrin-2 dehydrogenase/sirohydrochlorin ferrochelatase family protein [Desulfospira joergensenii]|uniref:precorrin-2 dehydrogenase/sirohydrochlorin ferrochelatase family protein n=1 Tax=Desulfospira joergensenii TaxID=53329 RepID=UPI0003B49022|nr:bifunctional precorrin-2 dehydrogenase/sirohydrochlorin ferrochelatase [Desulfospira joergensenii]